MGTPVLVISGLVGSGKSTTGRLAAQVLRERDISYALVDYEWLGESWPRPVDDPWNGKVAYLNLAAMWRNFSESGADRLIVCQTIERRSHLAGIAGAVTDAECTLVWLRAPLDTVFARIRSRQSDPDWYLDAAKQLAEKIDPSQVADLVVDNAARLPLEVAEDILRQVGWI
ncbi:MAG TPA: AAA family ATPase [Acidimicrobiales bacterium]